MFKRFKKIESLGTFKNYVGGSVTFSSLTFVFGLNCYGKSTLCEIFNSLNSNDASFIENRKSIPHNTSSSPKIRLSFGDNSSEPHQLKFENSIWNVKYPPQPIFVFDNRFVIESIFTGFDITHENKKQFTDFILGEENVKIANEISILKKDSRKKLKRTGEIEQIIKKLRSNIIVEEFIKTKPTDDIDKISSKISSTSSQLQKEEKNRKELEKISNLLEPDFLYFEILIKENIQRIRELLSKDFKEISKDAEKKLQYHTNNCFKHIDGKEENWIKNGIENYLKEYKENKADCPFCGQEITSDNELISVYTSFFNNEYNEFASTLEAKLSENLLKLQAYDLDIIPDLNESIKRSSKFKEFIKDSAYDEAIDKMESLISKWTDIQKDIQLELGRTTKDLEDKITEKTKKPHVAIHYYTRDSLKKLCEKLSNKIDDINYIILIIDDFINGFLASINPEKHTKTIQDLNDQLAQLEILKLRTQQTSICKEYEDLIKGSEQNNIEIQKKTTKLETEQVAFLNKYFEHIDRNFKDLGSKNFSISRPQTSGKGDKPVIGLRILYKNHDLSNHDLSSVFSESDRRALALSIFLAKVQSLPKDEQVTSLIVLDDPVTSFDDNRSTKAINKILDLTGKVDQIITFSHYLSFLKRFHQIVGKDIQYQLLQLNQNSESTIIEHVDSKKFLLDDHNKNLNSIEDFIQKRTNDDPILSLRIVFDTEIKRRFKPQIKTLDKSFNTSDILTGLLKADFISSHVYSTLDQYRITLNTDHHVYGNWNIEDKRGFTEEVYDYVFYKLSPAQKKNL
jgi:wobble nucleotide-excising tRNase